LVPFGLVVVIVCEPLGANLAKLVQFQVPGRVRAVPHGREIVLYVHAEFVRDGKHFLAVDTGEAVVGRGRSRGGSSRGGGGSGGTLSSGGALGGAGMAHARREGFRGLLRGGSRGRR
jgi:hypothetical protein